MTHRIGLLQWQELFAKLTSLDKITNQTGTGYSFDSTYQRLRRKGLRTLMNKMLSLPLWKFG